jgi:hypothetical protein
MGDDPNDRPRPWQPLTFGGVAAFAHAPGGRLGLVALLVALVAGASVIATLSLGWNPVLEKAIAALPQQGAITNGQFDWSGETTVVLAENPFLSLVVDMDGTGQPGQVSDLQIEFCRKELRLVSLGGNLPVAYGPGWTVPINRPQLVPLWGAWKPLVLGIAGVTAAIILMMSSAVLAAFYALPVRLLAFLADRDVTLGGSWRLSLAAIQPGLLVASAGVVAYTIGVLPLIGLGLGVAVSIVIGWVYLLIAPFLLPRLGKSPKGGGNPFESRSLKKGKPGSR